MILWGRYRNCFVIPTILKDNLGILLGFLWILQHNLGIPPSWLILLLRLLDPTGILLALTGILWGCWLCVCVCVCVCVRWSLWHSWRIPRDAWDSFENGGRGEESLEIILPFLGIPFERGFFLPLFFFSKKIYLNEMSSGWILKIPFRRCFGILYRIVFLIIISSCLPASLLPSSSPSPFICFSACLSSAIFLPSFGFSGFLSANPLFYYYY